MSKGLGKYIATFDYFDKILIVLSASRGGISITSCVTIIGAPAAIATLSWKIIRHLENISSLFPDENLPQLYLRVTIF